MKTKKFFEKSQKKCAPWKFMGDGVARQENKGKWTEAEVVLGHLSVTIEYPDADTITVADVPLSVVTDLLKLHGWTVAPPRPQLATKPS